MLFAITCIDKPGHAEVRAANRAAHLEVLKGLGDRLILGGPLLSDDGQAMQGSLLVIDFPDRAAAQAFCQQDPYAKAGLFQQVVIRAFRKVLPQG